MACVQSLRTITVSGEAKVRGENDLATLSLTIRTEDKKSSEARKKNAEKMRAVFDLLEKYEINRKFYQTSGLQYEKVMEVETSKRGGKTISHHVEKGWALTNGLTITMKDLDKLDELYDALADAGCTSLEGPVFHVSNTKELLTTARTTAFRDAKAKAELYAKEANVKVVALESLHENVRSFDEDSLMNGRYYASTMNHPPTFFSPTHSSEQPINPGTKQIIVTVNCVFRIV